MAELQKPPITLKIVSEGRPWDLRVIDAESGRLIENVVSVHVEAGYGDKGWDGNPKVVITLLNVPVELRVEHSPTYTWLPMPQVAEATA